MTTFTTSHDSRHTMKILIFTSFVLFFVLAIRTGYGAQDINADYTGPFSETDRTLFETFLNRARLQLQNKRYRRILVELKTAERILNLRYRPFRRRLARIYLETAEGFIFRYFKFRSVNDQDSFQKKQLMLNQARICLTSAMKLDPKVYGQARELLVALYKKRSELYFYQHRDKDLAALQNRIKRMGEQDNEQIMRKKLQEHRKQQARTRKFRKYVFLRKLEDEFLQALKHYQTSENKFDDDTYKPLVKIINKIINETPNPPGATYLYQLIKKHKCYREFREVNRFR